MREVLCRVGPETESEEWAQIFRDVEQNKVTDLRKLTVEEMRQIKTPSTSVSPYG